MIAAALVLAQLAGAPQLDEEPRRPRDPFVFRSVLDGRPRMVTLALDDELWVAYDATDGTLYRAWKGGVAFAGAVYDGVHGPQPVAAGQPYRIEPGTLDVRRKGTGPGIQPERRWLGYRLADGRATLRFAVACGREESFVLEETPELARGTDGTLFLARTLRALDVPHGVRVELDGRALGPEGLELRHALDPADVAGVPALAAPAPTAEPAEHGASGAPGVVLTIPSVQVAPVIDGVVDAAWEQATPVALERLVFGVRDDGSDLAATARLCYDAERLYVLFDVVDERLANESSLPFHDDAVEVYLDGGHERRDYYDENDAQYVFGCGDLGAFWVTNAALALHPGVLCATEGTPQGWLAEVALPWANVGVVPGPGRMLGLELHVDDDDDDGFEGDAALAWYSTRSDSWSDPSTLATVQLGGAAEARPALGALEPGLALRCWWIDRPLSELPRLVPGQSPNVNTVVPAVDLSAPADFGGFAERFVSELTGYLEIPEGGAWTFRLTSDDGSRLWIDSWLLIDHDGLHSAELREGTIELGAGQHALRIEHFEEGGDERLWLEWRAPLAADFETVPASALSTPAGEVRVTAPGPKNVVAPRAVVTPGDRFPLAGVHPAFALASARPPDFEPKVGGLDFLPDGRLAVCTWDADGAVYLLDGVQGDDPAAIRATRFAAGLAEPLGLCVVDGRLFVLQKQELTELVDHDDDGVADEYRCVSAGWGVTPNFHEFAFGLVHADGAFWAALATAIEPGGASSTAQHHDRGRVIRIEDDGSWRAVAAGLRTPNGIGRGADGALFVADNQGDWLPSSKLVRVAEGAFFGNRSVDPEGTRELADTPPVVWLPQGEIGNSPSQTVLLVEGPYAGQLALGDVTHGGLKRVFVEQVGDVWQGCVFRFCQGLEAGVNRVARGPDGALYVGGLGSSGNWGQTGKLRHGLQRLTYTGAPVFELLAVRARTNGLELELTEPLPLGAGEDPRDYEVRDWRYAPTREYGGPKVDERELRVRSASVADDRRHVFLELDALRAGHVVYVRLAGPFASAAGRALWSTEAWYTLNALPADLPGHVRPAPAPRAANVLSDEERAQGFELLFDGASLAAWRGWRRDDVPGGWRAEDGTLALVPGADGGDLATRATFQDFELRLEWRVAAGGNSGIMYRASEERAAPWETGPEMQVLDDELHPDARDALTSSGACYALYAAPFRAARAAGEWNEARIRVEGQRVRHWQNGYLVADYELGSADWEARVSASKFASMPGYGREPAGHIVLQDHGDPVWYRSVRVLRLGR